MIRPRQFVYLLGFTIAPHITEIRTWVWITSALIVIWALISDHKPKYKPSRWLVHLLTLAFPALVYLQFKTLLGPDAATSLLLLMITLKLFEVYSYRDGIVILMLTMLLAMYHLVFRQDLFTTVYMVSVMSWAFYLLLKLNRPSQAPRSEKLHLKSLLGAETLVSIPVLLCLFFFFPRFSSPIGRFIEKNEDVTGFSENLQPGMMANLANSNEVAFRVEFTSGRALNNDELYFRGQTLEITDGINWLKASNRNEIPTPTYYDDLEGQHYRITFEPRFNKLIFTLNQTYAFKTYNTAPGLTYFDNATIKTKKANQLKFQLLGVHSDQKYRYEDNGINQLMLPNNFFAYNPRTKELVQELKAKSIAETMRNIRHFFKTKGFTYSMQTPEYASLDQLLFINKLGFCEHFASAATLLARSMGIRSRVVIGFQGGELNEYGDYLIVRDRHAHAWMEYVNKAGEWQIMDPTAAVSNYRIAQGLTLNELEERRLGNSTLTAIAKDLWNMMDNINNRFALALLDMNRETQLDWLRKLGFESPNRRTIWKVFAGAITFMLAIIMFILWLRKPKIDPTQKLRLELIAKLNDLNIGYSQDLGPLETLELLKAERPEAKVLQVAVEDYMDLRYSAKPSHDAGEILRRLDQI